VLALFNKDSLSLRSTLIDISVKNSIALEAALWKESAIVVGWIPLAKSFSVAFKILPAKTTTEVVPSPASISWAADKSTNYKFQFIKYWRKK